MENIYTLYINLTHRTDRKENLEKNFKELGITQVERIDAVWKQQSPAYGHVLSFIKTLKRAKELDRDILICEDDFHVEKPELFLRDLNRFFSEGPTDLDVLLFGANNQAPVKYSTDYYVKVNKVFASPAYFIKKHYFQKLLDLLEISEKYIYVDPYFLNYRYFSDVMMNKLQLEDNWYMLFPNGCTQLPGYSDIVKKDTDYTNLMYTLLK